MVAGFALSAWIAIGSFFVGRATDDTVVALPASLLVGSGLTAAAYAILTRFGFVDIAIWSVAAVSLIALALRRSATSRMIRELGAEYRTTLRESRLLRVLAVPIAAILWICAIAPPRDADVMRYHLAHIRQIISDGRWERIPDYHYAFPFGWTLDYLPFERIHLVQAASLVNLGLWLVMVGGLLKISRVARTIPPPAFICAAFLVHPFVPRVFSSATPDGYGVFVVYTIAVLLLTFDLEDLSRAAMLGFVSWIGAQSRYQLLAVAIAGTLVFLGLAIRRRSSRAALRFSTGVVAAIALCAPFYIANLNDFGNPFWPLLVPEINGTNAYADRLAALYSASLVGHYDLTAFGVHFYELITTLSLVPLALVLVFLIPASMTSHTPRYRRVAVFGSLILLLWAIAQPRLFPKHVVLLLPLGPLLAVAALDGRTAGRVAARAIHAAFGAAIVAMLALSSIFSWDYIRYAITGNSADYHRFTWYYPVYEWANRSTPRNARFLVVAYSGHSYYLDRQYRRADPWLSGVVDWSRVSSAADLDKVVREGGYDFMIYDDRDWSDFEGGAAMSNAVKSAIAQGTMVPVHRFNEKLYSSRFFRDFTETTVYVLRRGRR